MKLESVPKLIRFLSLLGLLLLPASLWAQASDQALSVQFSNGMHLGLQSNLRPISLNQIHSWRLDLKDSANRAVSGAEISVIGGMPEHDHGLPTQPQITGEAEPGSYILQGMRFHMPGLWRLEISIDINGFSEMRLLEFRL